MLAHLARYVAQNGMAILQFDTKLRVWQGLHDLTNQFDDFFLTYHS